LTLKIIPSVFMYAMNIRNDVIGLVLRANCKSKQVTDFIAWPSRCHVRNRIYQYWKKCWPCVSFSLQYIYIYTRIHCLSSLLASTAAWACNTQLGLPNDENRWCSPSICIFPVCLQGLITIFFNFFFTLLFRVEF
jgi:hypothetical protein